MRELILALERGDRPAYLRIADAARAAVRDGRLARGESLPSTRALARTLRVNRHTVMAAMRELVAEGWLASGPRRGYRVTESLPSRFFEPARAPSAARAAARHRWRLVRSADGGPPASPPAGVRHAFQSGLADLRLFPHREFKSFVGDALTRAPLKVLDYGDPAGHPPLIDALKTYLRRVRAVSGRELVITHGSQEGIFLAAQLLIAPGDAAVVEDLGYPPAWSALRAAGAELIGAPVDAEGLDPDALEKILRRRRVRLIYTTPLHQYPTTVTLPVARRLRLYEAAARHGVPILEDDYDHEFHYRSQPLAPLAADDPDGRVIHVSTFSKVLFPSVRIGFMAVPPALAPALARHRRIVSRQNETVLQDAVARWMNDGGFERHLRRMRRVYEERRAAIAACLEEGRDAGLPLSWATPDGGMAVWADIGSDADRAARRALELGVRVQPESMYRLRPGPGRHLRLGFANQTPREIALGMRLLFRALD